MILIHDLHLGVQRSAGTSPASALALRNYLLAEFENLLDKADTDLTLLGDLLDTHQIPMTDLLRVYTLLNSWLIKGHKLNLIPGNHDLSTDSSKLSSFQFLAALLQRPTVTYAVGGRQLTPEIYSVSHVLNQDIFDIEIAKVPACKYLLLHCNYNNPFASGDHSLNLTEQQAKDCKAEFIVIAHEHHSRTELKGKVYIPGNQFPSSVSDCLDSSDKFMTQLADRPIAVKVWDKSNYAEMDWRNPVKDSAAQFVRFVGTAKPGEAAEMSTAIARYRKDSEAFVITNAVRVGEDEEMATLTLNSHEAIKSFDVMEAVKKLLTEDENKILESLT